VLRLNEIRGAIVPKVQGDPDERGEAEIPRSSSVTSATGNFVEQRLDYRMRQLVASNLAQAAIISSEKPLTPEEMVRLYAEIFVELFRQNEADRLAK